VGVRNVMGRGTRRLGRRGGFDSFCSLVTDFSSTHTLHTHVEKKKPFTHNRTAMRSFVFIAFALDCIEKSEVFCLVRWKVVEEGRGVVGGNAATR